MTQTSVPQQQPTAPATVRGTRGGETQSFKERIALSFVIGVPFAALVIAVPVVWGWGMTWTDLIIAVVMYAISGHGVTVGFHRLFTHSSFKAKKALRVGLAIAGSLAVQGPVIRWVADHRKHHRYSDHDGDPHSPWRYGETLPALMKGLWHAHIGWLYNAEQTNQQQYAPDLLKDRAIVRVSRAFPYLVLVSLLLPAAVGGLVTWSWQGILTAFFWGSLVRIALLHHTTWSINSICHAVGERPFRSRDRSGNVWWLAVLSMGESWHNLHHSDPTAARHGVLRGQIDSSARIIWLFEKFGWVRDVRWPSRERVALKLRGEAAP
ncbi:Stearoyl-CoA 9-desaturase [Catenulispora acidiphila DSM 44928]|uniref:Stearoyl-CoA 9-desaturase n=1 Tax=Catenulispora acidiphila (strain DSM 44928 / JCM 14897 / NBRC 102108 / NRRL B-24433 / ID139908) TaxID=479433 RepID=C7QHI3_CATAD|nr:Stearoyl-CoA 9-desaturase [Catenulispora acidiphila DSM 44928]